MWNKFISYIYSKYKWGQITTIRIFVMAAILTFWKIQNMSLYHVFSQAIGSIHTKIERGQPQLIQAAYLDERTRTYWHETYNPSRMIFCKGLVSPQSIYIYSKLLSHFFVIITQHILFALNLHDNQFKGKYLISFQYQTLLSCSFELSEKPGGK